MKNHYLVAAFLLCFPVFHGLVKVNQQLHGELPSGFVSALSAMNFDSFSVKADELLTMDLQEKGKEAATLGALVDTKPLTVVAFFESWCAPCRVELPVLQALHKRHAVRGLSVVGVYSESTGEAVQKLSGSLGLTFPVMRGAAQVAARAGFDAVPSTVVFDRHHKVLRAARGLDKDLSAFVEEFFATAGAETHE